MLPLRFRNAMLPKNQPSLTDNGSGAITATLTAADERCSTNRLGRHDKRRTKWWVHMTVNAALGPSGYRRTACGLAIIWMCFGACLPTQVAFSQQTNANGLGDAVTACQRLGGLHLTSGTVRSTELVRDRAVSQIEGNFQSATGGQALPFCRVVASSTQSDNAPVNIEVWLPLAANWNGRFFGTSNGGLEKIDYAELAGGINRGYAIAAMDLGVHATLGPRIYRHGINNPAFRENWAGEGVHLMTVVGKEILSAFYRRDPSTSIFAGSSGGGFQALAEARRYPEDYDGIIVGAPSLNYVNLGLSQGYRYLVSHRSATSAVPKSLLPALADEVLSQCDGIDGLLDGIIDDPRRCRPDFRTLVCRPNGPSSCFTPGQIDTLTAIYEGLRDPRTGSYIYHGFTPGGERSAGAEVRISGDESASFINDDTPGPLVWALGADFSKESWSSIDIVGDAEKYRSSLAPYENSYPEFAAFAARGGKLIFYSGWAESNANPADLVDFFEAIQRNARDEIEAKNFTRLFLAPGMFHHTGGPGPNLFGQHLAIEGTGPENDLIMAMERWITTGVAPDRITASKFEADNPAGSLSRTRPLCAYPKVARWNGRGSIDDQNQFRCVEP